MRPHDEKLPIPHKCNIWDYCSLSDDYIILFCAICHQVVGYQHGNVRYIKDTINNQYKQKEYSDETLNNSV